MALRKLESGAQELRWPSTFDEWIEFRTEWGLRRDTSILALALGEYARVWWGLRLWIISGVRTQEEQDELRARFARGELRHRPAERSRHRDGRAFDIGTDRDLTPGEWERVGPTGEALGLRWGGRFTPPDRPHFDIE